MHAAMVGSLAAAALLSFAPGAAAADPERPDVPQRDRAARDDKSVLLYDGSFSAWIDTPSGWTVDTVVAQRMGLCCVAYPAGSTWDDAEVVWYPRLLRCGRPAEKLEEVVAREVAEFRKQDPNVVVTTEPGWQLANGWRVSVRGFQRPAATTFERVAYVDSGELVVMVVVSARSDAALRRAAPVFDTTVRSIGAGLTVHHESAR